MRRDTFCDALQTPRVSPITFGILQRARGEGAVGQRRRSRRCDALRLGAARPGGRARRRGRRWRRCSPARSQPLRGTVVVLSGGNVDPALHARIVAKAGLGGVRGSGIRRARRGPGSTARPPASAPRARRRASSARRRGTGVRLRRRIRRRRSAFRASSRCTAGSFPRSARTPLRGAPAARIGMAANLDRSWLSLGEIRGENGEIFVGCDGASR